MELVESKLHPPPARPGIVARIGLVERLVASDGVPVVCVVAPAGYGKTTLLAQWAQHTVHRVGWVSLDQRDNDPAVLLTYPENPQHLRWARDLASSALAGVLGELG